MVSIDLKEITKNELYRGVRIWKRVQNVFNFAEGKKSRRKRSPAEWTRLEIPELRIIPDELWVKVQAVNQHGHDKYLACRQGGMNRTAAGRTYFQRHYFLCGMRREFHCHRREGAKCSVWLSELPLSWHVYK